MTHVDEGLLVALRDGAVASSQEATARLHLDACTPCRERLAALERRRSDVAVALEALDGLLDTVDTTAARASVRARVAHTASAAAGGPALVRREGASSDGGTRRMSGSRGSGWARAAGVILFLGAASAAAALPHSPLHRWVRGLLGPETPTASSVESTPTASVEPPETTGVRLSVPSGPLRVVLQGVAPDAEIEVRWMPGTEAAVFGPVGSRFTSAAGRLEARLTPGAVRVELPRAVATASLEVNGHTYLSRGPGGLEVPGPVVRQDASGIVFRVASR